MSAVANSLQDSQLLQDLDALVKQYLGAEGLALPAQAIGSPSVSDLLSAFGGGASLTLGQASVTLTDSDLTVSGQFTPVPGTALTASARFFVEKHRIELEVQAQTAPGQTLGLRALAAQFLPGVDLPSGIPDLGLTAMTLGSSPLAASFSFGSGQGAWTVPLGADGLTIGDVTLALARTAATESQPAATTATLSGSLALDGAEVAVTYSPPGDLVIAGHTPSVGLSSLLGGVCGADVVSRLSLPSAIAGLTLPEADVLLDVAQQRLSVSTKTDAFDAIGLTVGKDGHGAWGFSAGLMPAAHWKLSDLGSALQALDGLSLNDTALVVSSAADGSIPLPAAFASHGDLELIRGVNLFSTLDLRGLGADKLLGIETLGVHAAIGTSLESFVIEAEIAGHMKLAENLTLEDIQFRLHPAPNAFEIAVLGQLGVVLQGSPLTFTGGLSVTPTGASFAATMAGDWVEPFNARGVTINGLAVELGIAFDDGLPIIGLAGGMTLGGVHGKAAVRIDSGNPSLAMVAIAFDSLNLGDVLAQVCDASIHGMIPAESAHTILNVTFREAEFAIVPQTTHVGEIVYEQGLRIGARVDFWGLEADGKLAIDFDNGVLLDGRLDPIVIGDAFRLTGAAGQADPTVHFELGPGKLPEFNLSGAIDVMGISAESAISLSDSGFSFLVDGKIFQLFECSLAASGGHLDSEDAFMVQATMKNDLFAVLREHATQEIAQAAQDASAKIGSAQADVDAAQAKVNGLNGQIDAMRRTVQGERDQARQQIDGAKQAVAAAQQKVDSLSQQLDAARHTVQAERDAAQQKLAGAQRDLATAQNSVASLNQQIATTRTAIQAERASAQRGFDAATAKVTDAQNAVNSIQGQIDALNNWYYSLPKVSWPWKDSQATRSVDFAARQAAFYTALGTAKGVLSAAQGVLNAARSAMNATPVDADPRMLGLFTALGTATAAVRAASAMVATAQAAVATIPVDADPRVVALLAARGTATSALLAAQGILSTAQAALATIPIDADPRVAGLITGLGVATGALTAANGILSGVKATVGGVLAASDYIARVGLGGVLDVRAASFEASLSTAKGGKVSLSADVDYLGQAQHVQFAFDFQDPVSGAKQMAHRLMGV